MIATESFVFESYTCTEIRKILHFNIAWRMHSKVHYSRKLRLQLFKEVCNVTERVPVSDYRAVLTGLICMESCSGSFRQLRPSQPAIHLGSVNVQKRKLGGRRRFLLFGYSICNRNRKLHLSKALLLSLAFSRPTCL